MSDLIDCVFNNSHNCVAVVNKFFMPIKEISFSQAKLANCRAENWGPEAEKALSAAERCDRLE
jgi:hypothetical protein